MSPVACTHRPVQEVSDGVVVFRLEGLALWEDEAVHRVGLELLEAVRGREKPRIVVNLAGVGCVPSQLLAKFLAVHRIAEEAGGSLVLCGMDAAVTAALRLTGLDDLLMIRRDEPQAVSHFRAAL